MVGLGSSQTIIPAPFFGEYTVDVEGTSEHFRFVESYPETRVAKVTEIGATYRLDIPVVALSCRMAGTVRDSEGNPIEGAKVYVKKRYYSGISKGDGSYSIEDIWINEGHLGHSKANMVESLDYYVEKRYEESICEKTDNGMVRLRAGKTNTEDFTLTARGDIEGHVTDKAGEPASSAEIEVTDSAGNKDSTTTDGDGSYILNKIVEGIAEVKATCEKG